MDHGHVAKKMKTTHDADTILDKIDNFKRKVENQFEFVKDAVDIRVESMKAQLDDAREIFFQELDEAKEQMLKEAFSEIDLSQLNQNMVLIEEKLEKLNKFDIGVKFNTNDLFDETVENLIGDFYLNYNATLIDKISVSKTELIRLPTRMNDILALKNGNILISSDETPLGLHDKKFNLINRITDSNGKPIAAAGMTSDSFNNIYIIDTLSNKILKLDQEMNLIHSVRRKRKYTDIRCYMDKLYCCRYEDKQLDIFSLQLKFLGTFELDIPIGSMDIHEDIVCISHNFCAVSFYTLPKFEYLFSIKKSTRACVYKGLIYGFFDRSNNASEYFKLFDKNGKLLDEVDFSKRLSDCSSYGSIISIINDHLVFSCGKVIEKIEIQ